MKRLMPTAGWIAVILALLISFLIDLRNVAAGGSVDFRNRITGVRLLEHGIDPYRFIWHEGDSPLYADLRNNPNLPVSKTTVSPALLLVYAPLATLPYRVAQFTWLIAQWLMLLAMTWLWWRHRATLFAGWLVVLFVTAFTYTVAWRWEAERGQTYLLLGFLFACWLTATLNRQSTGGFLAGCIAGLLVALRPPFGLLLPFIALHRRHQLAGAAVGLLLGFGSPLLVSSVSWVDYFSAMRTNSDLYRHGIHPPRPDQNFPSEIEGTPTTTMGNMFAFSYGDISVHALLRRIGLEPFSATIPLLIFLTFFALWLGWSHRQPVELLLPGVAAWLFLVDLFLPAIRYSYYDVVILNAVLAGIILAARIPWAFWPCALALPMGWAAYFLSPVLAPLLYLPAICFTLGAILFLFPPARKRIES
jgi:Glycosyltransferase family 87